MNKDIVGRIIVGVPPKAVSNEEQTIEKAVDRLIGVERFTISADVRQDLQVFQVVFPPVPQN